jgi:hypothetical protein
MEEQRHHKISQAMTLLLQQMSPTNVFLVLQL